ncbi:universal stress protein [Streptomyces sp. NPDC093568]|uniref:universal stress protein n=1 Tax=Streptomyces sp. NPDC093568 TaxID=3366041 RepID=UPI003802EB33
MTTARVVVGMDGSQPAVRALDRAAHEAESRAAVLDVVYAVADRDAAPPVLAYAVSRLSDRHPGLPVTASAFEGDPVEAVTHHGRDALLTVIGCRGLGGVAGRLFGSVSLRLAARAHGPLLVVRGDRRATEHGDVLLGVESDRDAEAAAYAFAEAERRGVPLRVLHAWTYRQLSPALPAPVPLGRVPDEAVRLGRTEEAVPRFAVSALRERYREVAVETRAVRSAAAHALAEATREADVVVIGAHRHSRRGGGHLGHVTHTLLHRSRCPLVIVPSDC